MFWPLLFGSFFLVAWGQPSWVPGLGTIASVCGLALFWKAMLSVIGRQRRFWLAVVWFASVQGIQLSWMTSMHYMGPFILLVFALLLFAMGLQFGLLSLFFSPGEPIPLSRTLSIAGGWVLLEWIRLFPCTGFPWNPIGLALADSPYSIQIASLFGVYGLSFAVIWTNLALLNAFSMRKWAIYWAVAAFFPHLFGFIHQQWIESFVVPQKTLAAALVQTALFPEQRDLFLKQPEVFVPPLKQWERVWRFFQDHRTPLDLIILPEGAFPYGAFQPIYSLEEVKKAWSRCFGQTPLPPLQAPHAVLKSEVWKVTNSYLAQALADHFHSDVILGLDDQGEGLKYNAAFHFRAGGAKPNRYEKRILIPVGEYIPLQELRILADFFSRQFQVCDSFRAGEEAKVFFASVPIGISICAEETYSHLIREGRAKGAKVLVSISNDVWFPSSRLPWHHFDHGKVRAAENGAYLLRSSNTGITGVIDCFGRPVYWLEPSEKDPAVLFASFPVCAYCTLYTWWGDWAILVFSFSALLFGWKKNKILR